MEQQRVFRDPVYGNISVPWSVLLALVDSPEFQRLRNIRQLGMCFTTFHGAEHSRFQHALGVSWLMHRVLDLWHREGRSELPLWERQSACAAALLHDIGHGPFSHALERVFSGVDHEALGRLIVKQRLGRHLGQHDLDPDVVLAMMEGSYHRPVFHELLASQLDVDRMDYLQRDSLYTGVKYGLFDIDRIVHTLVPMEDQSLLLAVDFKGTQAVEEFLFSRYFMYWQIYFHRTVRSAELMLRLVLERARAAFCRDAALVEVPTGLDFLFQPHRYDPEQFLEAFLGLDDFDIFTAMKRWCRARDPVLADLAARLTRRQLFKALPNPGRGPALEAVRAVVQDRFQDDWRFYLREDTPGDAGFGVYRPDSANPIRVLLRRPARWKEISEVTRTQAILSLAQKSDEGYLMIAPECREAALSVLPTSSEG